MQKDMHFYGIYALARSAGIRADNALTIAYASQFVDDAIDDDAVMLSNQSAILPTMTSHKPLDYKNAVPGDQWKVWLPFHFLPGNQGDSFIEKLVCRKDSALAKLMLDHTLSETNRKFWPHLVGITAHVYADTFSHFGFVGISHQHNRIINENLNISDEHPRKIIGYNESKFEEFKSRLISKFVELVPVGHGAVGTYPDRPYLNWSFEYENGEHKKEDTVRNNCESFLEGSEALYKFFVRFAEVNPEVADKEGGRGWDEIKGTVEKLLERELTKHQRCQKWKDAILSDAFSKENGDSISYEETLWRPRQAEYETEDLANITDSDACKFIRAALKHREFVLHELLPDQGLIIY